MSNKPPLNSPAAKAHKKTALRNQTEGCFFVLNGPEGIRTLGLRVANAALSQLSYEPLRDDSRLYE